jgi:hypothetical protein
MGSHRKVEEHWAVFIAGGRESGGCKEYGFHNFAKGLKTLRKRLEFWGGGGRNICMSWPQAAEYIMITNKRRPQQIGGDEYSYIAEIRRARQAQPRFYKK